MSDRIVSRSMHEHVSDMVGPQIADVTITAHDAADNLGLHD